MTDGLILASASPTRARLLAMAELDLMVVAPAAVDEGAIKRRFQAAGRTAVDCALALAEAKARDVAERRDRAFVIGADQLLACNGTWFDKPSDLAEARAQLRALRGHAHELVTAVCVVQNRTRLWHTVSRPRLFMREFSDAFLDDYIVAEGAAVLGSVGAYRLEGRGVQLFSVSRATISQSLDCRSWSCLASCGIGAESHRNASMGPPAAGGEEWPA